MVLELIAFYPELIQEIYCLENWVENIAKNIPYCIVNNTELSQLSDLKTSNKVLALVHHPRFTNYDEKLTLVLDNIQDPGNLGTIIRLADWFGVSNLVCSPNTVDVFNPKVVQATMGSIFRIPVVYKDLAVYLKESTRPIYGAVLGGKNVYLTPLNKEAILVLGNEGKGISASLLPLFSQQLEIPRFGMAESLNVSMAASILLSEVCRP